MGNRAAKARDASERQQRMSDARAHRQVQVDQLRQVRAGAANAIAVAAGSAGSADAAAMASMKTTDNKVSAASIASAASMALVLPSSFTPADLMGATQVAERQLERDGSPFTKDDLLQLYFVVRATVTPSEVVSPHDVFTTVARTHTTAELRMLLRTLIYNPATVVQLSERVSSA